MAAGFGPDRYDWHGYTGILAYRRANMALMGANFNATTSETVAVIARQREIIDGTPEGS